MASAPAQTLGEGKMTGTTIRANITALDAAIALALADPSPNYTLSGPEGSRTLAVSSYISELIKNRNELQALLVSIEPYVVSTRQVM